MTRHLVAATHPVSLPWRRPLWRGWPVLGAAAILLAPAAAGLPVQLVALVIVAGVVAAVAYVHPPAAAYAMVVATPLTAGFPRSGLFPLLRPHEALAVTLGAGVALRAAFEWRAGRGPAPRLGRTDVAILSMAISGSFLPLLWMAARGLTPALDDLLYAAVLWKFYGLFLLIRSSVRTPSHVRLCLGLSVGAASVTAIIAILQSLEVAAVLDLVNALYPDEDNKGLSVGRGSSTLGSSIAVGDVMAFNLAICLGFLLRGSGRGRVLVPLALLFTFGAFASGQFSGLIALVVAVFAVAVVTGYVGRLLVALVPVALAGAVVLRPVLEHRLAQVDVGTGIPQSWQVRFDNLRFFVWPHLASSDNWMFGVRPWARIRIDAPWGPYIYIESGHTWLLWSGGVPLLAAFLYFSWVCLRRTGMIARTRRDSVGVAAIAGFASLLVTFVLMAFDPHISMRGAADLLFTLLALATGTKHRPGPRDAPAP